jgi:RNA polymerase sigma factor (sigma-70 family)
MKDSQTLLEEYTRTGSDSAFRELVARYLGLVYSTALRLVDGDAHLAEDVAQTVFMDLAQKAGGLSSRVMLGGWLHQRTYNVAAPMMRSRRRRLSREREAAQLNALQNESAADLDHVAPMLDEAITHLAKEDRTAIILRFFERRDFRSIGQALGSNEDAARMRVNRALSKLHLLLTKRGAPLSLSALGMALASETLTAAPTGLVASVAGTALAGSAAGKGLSVTLLKITAAMTKLKAGVISAVVIGGVATSLVISQQARAKLREQDEVLRQQSAQLAQLAADNERLSGLVSKGNVPDVQLSDLPKLKAEAESLRRQTNDLAMLREQNQRLQQQAATKQTPLEINEERIAKIERGKNWLLAFKTYAVEHQGQFPTNFEMAASLLEKESNGETNMSPEQFEMVYRGADVLTNSGDVVMLKEKQTWLGSDGKWHKIYGMVDGSVQDIAMPSQWRVASGKEINYDTFEAFERDHIATSPAK